LYPPLLNIHGGKKLNDDLIILILLRSHDIPQVLGFTSTHYLIKDLIMLSLHVGQIYPLRNYYGLSLCNDDRLIEVLLKCHVKHIINTCFLLNKRCIFFPLFPYQICLAFVDDFLPPIQIQR
jgi:hypothetical protein